MRQKQTDDPHNTIYQNAIRYKERDNAFMKKILISWRSRRQL